MGLVRSVKRAILTERGVRPPGIKPAAQVKIAPGPDPEIVIIPLEQHVGAPCEPMVEINDRVLVGQKIGDSREYISAPVHSSVSGEVTGIIKYPHPSGRDVISIQIVSDGLHEPAPDLERVSHPTDLEPQEIRSRIREGGIVGLGGAVFPTHVKLAPPEDKPVETVIVNGAECEPYLTGDRRLMLERGPDIIMGARIIKKAVGARRIVVAVEEINPDAIRAMREAGAKDNVEVAVLPHRYPQGAEKTLIKSILGREVPSGGLPSDVGAVVDNVGTCVAISDLLCKGMPLIERVVTISGDGIAGYANLRVKLGTLVNEVIDYCGGMVGEPGKVILGGPMMGVAQYTTAVPVTKATSGILVLRGENIFRKESPSFTCIRCGKCVKHCPMHLMPYLLGSYSDRGMWEELEKLNIVDCVECGCCSYICPTKNPLVQLIKVGKEGYTRRKKKMETLKKQKEEQQPDSREEVVHGG
jgi:H+/Na+-translocating ferredoxin:NAD+ oxidoreductase subunit C